MNVSIEIHDFDNNNHTLVTIESNGKVKKGITKTSIAAQIAHFATHLEKMEVGESVSVTVNGVLLADDEEQQELEQLVRTALSI